MFFLASLTENDKPKALLIEARDISLASIHLRQYVREDLRARKEESLIAFDLSAHSLMTLFNCANSDQYWSKQFNYGPVQDVTEIVYKEA